MKVRPILPLVVVVVGLLASAPSPRTARARQPGAGQAASPAGELYHALVIGNDDYASLPKLTTAVKDARAVARTLREKYGFRTKLLINATRSEIVAALSDYGSSLGADVSLLVYYAGHGHRDAAAGRAYWLPVDATREDASNWVKADEVTNALRAVRSRHVLVVSDSSYSGTLPHGLSASPSGSPERERFLQKMSAGRSRTLMTSGGDEPRADDGGSGLSVFASALLRGLRKIEGPRFTASDLFLEYVLSPVSSRTGQIPVYNPLGNSGHESGDFVFERIKPTETAPWPCDEEDAKTSLYKTFLDNFKGGPEHQKVAYEAGKEYISKYEICPKESDKTVVAYIQKWVGKYEQSLRLWQEAQRRQGRQP